MKGGQTRVCSRGNAIWRGCDGATGAIFFRSVRPRSGSAYLLHVHICMSDNTSLQPAVSCVSVCVCLCVKASFLDVIFLLIFLSSQHSHICSLGPAETNTDPPPRLDPAWLGPAISAVANEQRSQMRGKPLGIFVRYQVNQAPL